MSAEDTVKNLFELLEANDLDAAAAMLDDGFTFSGPIPEPVDGQQWLGLQAKLNAAFPDLSFNLDHVHIHGDVIHATVQLTGTHEAELDLSPMGMPNVPATGKSINLPSEELSVSVEGDKVTSVSGPAVEGGGVMGILSQLGAAPHDH